MSTIYRCTECDAEFKSFNKAARCHWGIGGVVEVEEFDPDAPVVLEDDS